MLRLSELEGNWKLHTGGPQAEACGSDGVTRKKQSRGLQPTGPVGEGIFLRSIARQHNRTRIVVPEGRLELPRAEAHCALNAARLPIPPLRQSLRINHLA